MSIHQVTVNFSVNPQVFFVGRRMTELTMLLKKCFTFVVIVQVLLVTTLTVVPSVAAESDDLMDFDFDSEVKSELNDTKPTKNQVGFDNAFEEFFDIMDPQAEEMGSHLQQKEKRIKLKMLTAWKNPNMQRKFAEVLPILKVMTSQQKIALAALVSAQVGSKQGRELNLDQVRLRKSCIYKKYRFTSHCRILERHDVCKKRKFKFL